MPIDTRQMVGLPSSPSFQYKQLNPAYQSDPRRILGQTLMTQGSSSAPVRTPLQGLGRLSSALVGAYLQKGAMDRQVSREEERTNQIMGMLPDGATEQQRQLASMNPDMLLQSLMRPKTTSNFKDMGNGFMGVENTSTGAFGNVDKSIGSLAQVKTPTQTTAYRNAVNIGLVPGTTEFNDYIKKSSDKSTNINMTSSPGSKSTVDKYTSLSEKSDNSYATLNKLEELEGYIANGVKTGFGVESVNEFDKVRNFFNSDYKVQKIAGIENFNATTTQLVLPLVKQLGVNPSDNDLKMTVKGAATLGKTTAGNSLIIKTLKVQHARQVLLFDEASKFISLPENKDIEKEGLQGKVRLENHLKSVRATHPLYTKAGKLIQAEYMALTGTKMIEDRPKSKLDALIKSGDIIQ